ncbi:MAG: LCP family protein [Oscillospiraceae bacterium]|nr:LCP family protein [Oscillospiraceae bacterium]
MAKKGLKLGLTYFCIIIGAIVLIGGAGIFMFTRYLSTESSESSLQDQLADDDTGYTYVSDEDYVPSFSESRTGLFIYDSGADRSNGICIAVIRLSADNGEILVMPLQSDIYAEVDGTGNTLYEFYRVGGITQCKKAVEAALGITVDKYMKLSESTFNSFANYMGNVSYTVPYNLVYENTSTGESIIVKKGAQILDSNTLCKVLTFPEYKNGEEYRAVTVGTLIVSLINLGADGMLRDNMDTVFTNVINGNIETDITKYDYDDVSRAMSYIFSNYDSPASPVMPSGTYDRSGYYILDDSFIAIIDDVLYLNDESASIYD